MLDQKCLPGGLAPASSLLAGTAVEFVSSERMGDKSKNAC